MGWRRLRAIYRVLAMWDVSLGGQLSEFALAVRTRNAVVRGRGNLCCQLVNLLLGAAMLHHAVHFSGNLDCFLKLVRLFAPLCLLFLAYLLHSTLTT